MRLSIIQSRLGERLEGGGTGNFKKMNGWAKQSRLDIKNWSCEPCINYGHYVIFTDLSAYESVNWQSGVIFKAKGLLLTLIIEFKMNFIVLSVSYTFDGCPLL